jgi:predicted Holliday junction resolvase-like endonuclease
MELLAKAIGYTALILFFLMICLVLVSMIYAIVETQKEQRRLFKQVKINDKKLAEALKKSLMPEDDEKIELKEKKIK